MSQTHQEVFEKLSSSPSSAGTSEKSTEPEVVQGIFKYEEPAPTYYDYQRQELQNTGLFKTRLTLDKGKQTVQSKELETPSILVKSFGMRNLKSLQDALKLQEELKLQELYMRQQQEALLLSTEEAEEKSTSTITTMFTSPGGTVSTTTLSTETDPLVAKDKNRTKKHLEYLMGLESLAVGEEGEEPVEEAKDKSTKTEEFQFSTSKSMKTAQKYLKLHRIFDLFQFITAHLLSACPDDPIEFILELLNKCLLYRSRLCPPPLLYDKQHLEQLFKLMDRLGSGSVQPDNYERAMKTLGICEYNRQPALTEEKTIDKETFVDEAYKAELALFDDLIKVKCLKKKKKRQTREEVKSEYSSCFSSTSSDAQLMPSDFLLSIKKQKKKKRSETVQMSAAEEELEG